MGNYISLTTMASLAGFNVGEQDRCQNKARDKASVAEMLEFDSCLARTEGNWVLRKEPPYN